MHLKKNGGSIHKTVHSLHNANSADSVHHMVHQHTAVARSGLFITQGHTHQLRELTQTGEPPMNEQPNEPPLALPKSFQPSIQRFVSRTSHGSLILHPAVDRTVLLWAWGHQTRTLGAGTDVPGTVGRLARTGRAGTGSGV